MALTDESNGGIGAVMPVGPLNYGGNYGGYGVPFFPMMGGYGNGFGGDSGWFILLLILAMGNGGWGGFGGFGGFGGGLGIDFPWLLNGQNQINANTNSGFDHAATQSALGNLSTAVTSGFGDVQLGIAGVNQNICQSTGNIQNSLCQGFAGTTSAVTGAQNALAQQLYNNEINSLNRSFAEQTANTQAINGISSQLAKCCCDQELATTRLQGVIQVENAADRAAVSDGIRDVLTATNAQTQRILDKLCDQELAAAQRENNELRTRLNMADLAASQAAQTAALVADNTAQTQYIVNRVAPYPVPSYNVPAPYGCGYGPGYGYSGNFGFNPFGNVGYGNGSF